MKTTIPNNPFLESQPSLYRALASRDKRYDGRFYVGVRTTWIYCRPTCPARPKRENVLFFRSQTEAENAGYRPCLRCRPDITPGTRMWEGTAAVVGRALQLISQGDADQQSVDQLASRLGVTGRHLRRLFDEHLGASPIEIAQSKRLHLARQLLTETKLPITEIAYASGFGSIRRFNDCFVLKYRRAPRDFRARAKAQVDVRQGSALCFDVPILPPYDWESLFIFLKSHAVVGVESVTGEPHTGIYKRILRINEKIVTLRVAKDRLKPLLKVQIEGADVGDLRFLLSRIKAVFDVEHNPFSLGAIARPEAKDGFAGIRIPGAFDPFETAITIIAGQLVSVAQAQDRIKKLVAQFGERSPVSDSTLTHFFPTPKILCTADLSQSGFTKTRAFAIQELSRQIHDREIVLSSTAPLDETRKKLLGIKGIGPWTVEMIAMRCLGDIDAFPAGDLVIGRALKHLGTDHSEWSPWRAYLTLWLWKNQAIQTKSMNNKGEST